MLKKFVCVACLCAVVALSGMSVGCKIKDADAPQTSVKINLKDMAQKVDALSSTVTALDARIQALPGGSNSATKAELDAVKTTVAALQTQINTLKAPDLSGYALKTSVDGVATAYQKADADNLATYKKLVDDLTALVSALTARVKTLEDTNTANTTKDTAQDAKIAALEARIAALEHPPTTTPTMPASEAVKVEIVPLAGQYLTVDGEIDTVQNFSLYFKYTNAQPKDYSVKFIVNLLSSNIGMIVKSSPAPSLSVVGGTSPVWALTLASNGMMIFRSVLNYTVKANETKEMILLLSVAFDGGAGLPDYFLLPQVSVE